MIPMLRVPSSKRLVSPHETKRLDEARRLVLLTYKPKNGFLLDEKQEKVKRGWGV